ncbi:hypothetical protein PoB_002322100 [Plakobranchus ocellatus]|uniref:Uncharacterized protein n=1 Tax=Plakobranchus ocellatus TaxID=259542 RepID=A0AAV3ZQD5_9GAST|nr:hypothetical protein PoB_002322100 [Plakobranchus ocellatus]
MKKKSCKNIYLKGFVRHFNSVILPLTFPPFLLLGFTPTPTPHPPTHTHPNTPTPPIGSAIELRYCLASQFLRVRLFYGPLQSGVAAPCGDQQTKMYRYQGYCCWCKSEARPGHTYIILQLLAYMTPP